MNVNKIKAGIIGSAGYTGGEMLRLLVGHPEAELVFAHSRSHAGQPVSHVHNDLYGDTGLHFTGELDMDIDVLFLCVGHGEARVFLEKHPLPAHIRVIDLSQDFRMDPVFSGNMHFVYGLPECNRQAVAEAMYIANPGCFATAIQLALLPLAQSGNLHREVHVTGITGATGAGQKLQASAHFAWRVNNIQAYKSLSHQHIPEVVQTLQQLDPACGRISFIPWRGDFARGIYVTAYTEAGLTAGEAYDMYESFYGEHVFTHVSRDPVDLKQVVNTNKCIVHLEQADGRLVIHAAIDNLLKGASGQAVQNMNLMFGLPEHAGLKLKAAAF